MQHILFKIKNIHFTLQSAKTYDQDGNTRILRNVQGNSTCQLSSNDLRELADTMDRAGIKTIKFRYLNRYGIHLAINE